jgi:hypothetical protein
MSGSIEMDKCDFCQEIKQVERTYLHPSKYVKEQGAFINKSLYNEGDYFIIVKTCSDCGTPTSSQTEISDEGAYYSGYAKGYNVASSELFKELSDEEIQKYAQQNAFNYYEFIQGAKWYREQLKQRQ